MYIKVKTMDRKDSVNFILTVSKMSVMEEIRLQIKNKLGLEPECQRLFFRGKQVIHCKIHEKYILFNRKTIDFFYRWTQERQRQCKKPRTMVNKW